MTFNNVPEIEKIHDKEREIEELKQRIIDCRLVIQDLAQSAIRSSEEPIDMAAYLYWHEDSVAPSSIGDVLGVRAGICLTNMIGGDKSPYACERCGKTIIASSRTNMKDQEKHGRHLCYSCYEKEIKENHEYYLDFERAREDRIKELRSMPYKEYLKTAEWDTKRKAALKRAGYRCQVCNADGKQLNVHHRTYERRGIERSSDLIVLCADCHKLYHFPEGE
jgi:5-methylcytosine-specific restriction endonuclease McrA